MRISAVIKRLEDEKLEIAMAMSETAQAQDKYLQLVGECRGLMRAQKILRELSKEEEEEI